MADFKNGDEVQLKSGGPIMTIQYIDSEIETISCSWFDGKRELKNGSFHPDSLKFPDEHDSMPKLV